MNIIIQLFLVFYLYWF